MYRYRFRGLDKNGTIRCYAWSPLFTVLMSFDALEAYADAEHRCWEAIKEFIKIEGNIYGQLADWGTQWEVRKKGQKDNKIYLKKPSSTYKKVSSTRIKDL